jgi:hypothetical protein
VLLFGQTVALVRSNGMGEVRRFFDGAMADFPMSFCLTRAAFAPTLPDRGLCPKDQLQIGYYGWVSSAV